MTEKIKFILHNIPYSEIYLFYETMWHTPNPNESKEDLECHIFLYLRQFIYNHRICLLNNRVDSCENNIVKALQIIGWLSYEENKYHISYRTEVL